MRLRRWMLRDADENQVAASHKYLTAGSKKIFPEDVHLADGSDSSSAQSRNFRNPTRDVEKKLLPSL
jgi:hypothetical protein